MSLPVSSPAVVVAVPSPSSVGRALSSSAPRRVAQPFRSVPSFRRLRSSLRKMERNVATAAAGANNNAATAAAAASSPPTSSTSTSTSDPVLSLPGARFVRKHLLQLAPYTPIEPFEVLSARLGRDPSDIVKLDANENPYGPPPEVARALGSMRFPNIYPDPETRALRSLLAPTLGVPMEQVLVGCGADELIDLLMRAVLDQGDKIVDCPPTFTMYAFDAAVNGAGVVTVPRLDGFKLDVPAISKAAKETGAKIVFVTSPNNPDGSIVSDDELLELLSISPECLVVLDEAYVEFSGESSRSRWVLEHENLVVLRTFSKSAALAGLRVGYGVFPAGLAALLWRAKQPYNVSAAAETAAVAALSNPAWLEETRLALVKERERLTALLETEIDWLAPFPSNANFVLCSVAPGRDAGAVRDRLAKEHGIMVRHYAKKQLSGFIRISVGKPEHTDRLLRALREL